MMTQPQVGWGRGGVAKGFKRAILMGTGVAQVTQRSTCYLNTGSPLKLYETPGARLELATNGLTVHCSTTELTRNRRSDSKQAFI